MKRKLAVLLAVIALATAAMAMPAASAGGHLQGEMDITLVQYQCPNDSAPGDGFITWLGTYEVGKKTFGIAFFPQGELEVIGETGFVYFDDMWTLFRLPRFMWHEDALVWAACAPWRIVMEADEAGIGTPDGYAYGAGHVTYGKKHFETYVGANAFWYGTYTNAEGTEFAADLWVFPGGMD